MDFSASQSLKQICLHHFALLPSPSQAKDVGAYVINMAFHAVSKQVALHNLSYAPADILSQHQTKLYMQWGMLPRMMLQRTNVTTKNATTNECYNERCYNEQMLQRTMLQRTNATMNRFINKIGTLQRTQMIQLTRKSTIGRRSTRVHMTCRAFPL